MATLGIFTVKTFYFHDGLYYTYGGFGKYLEAMCSSFDEVILQCRVSRAPPARGCYQVKQSNLKIVAVPALRAELGALFVQPLVFLRGLGVVGDSDVVHARMPDWTGVTGALAARICGKPCFHQIIGDTAELARSIPLTKAFGLGACLRVVLLSYDWCERRVSRGQLVFAQGQTAFDKHHQTAQRYLVLSAAHSIADVGQVNARCSNEKIRVLTVGRLQSVKNQALLIYALAKIRETDKRWEVRILGEGPKRNGLRALAESLGVTDCVALPGEVPHGSLLWDEYDQADIFALPSLSEGTPKVLLEAMARGCPVVASRVGGIPTAVSHEERGLLFESGDCEQLASALVRMAGDTDLRQRCQNAAWEFSKLHAVEESTKFMLEQVVRRWPSLAPLRRSHD